MKVVFSSRWDGGQRKSAQLDVHLRYKKKKKLFSDYRKLSRARCCFLTTSPPPPVSHHQSATTTDPLATILQGAGEPGPRNHVCCAHQEDHPQPVGSGRRRSVQVSMNPVTFSTFVAIQSSVRGGFFWKRMRKTR